MEYPSLFIAKGGPAGQSPTAPAPKSTNVLPNQPIQAQPQTQNYQMFGNFNSNSKGTVTSPKTNLGWGGSPSGNQPPGGFHNKKEALSPKTPGTVNGYPGTSPGYNYTGFHVPQSPFTGNGQAKVNNYGNFGPTAAYKIPDPIIAPAVASYPQVLPMNQGSQEIQSENNMRVAGVFANNQGTQITGIKRGNTQPVQNPNQNNQIGKGCTANQNNRTKPIEPPPVPPFGLNNFRNTCYM